jgi:hypothetical protein
MATLRDPKSLKVAFTMLRETVDPDIFRAVLGHVV